MGGSAVFCSGTWIFTSTGDVAPGEANLRAFKFCPAFCRFRAIPAAVFVVRHCIMGGIQQELGNNSFRQKLFHGIPVIKETDRIMPGSQAEEREYREGICSHRCVYSFLCSGINRGAVTGKGKAEQVRVSICIG